MNYTEEVFNEMYKALKDTLLWFNTEDDATELIKNIKLTLAKAERSGGKS